MQHDMQNATAADDAGANGVGLTCHESQDIARYRVMSLHFLCWLKGLTDEEAAPMVLSDGRGGAELVGRELHIKASFLNHSCAPNCLVMRGRGRGAVVALQPIAVRAGFACRAALHAW